jgi:spermidine synthase
MRQYKGLILLFFFLSGACGLIYEIVWTRLLTLVIGNTVFSVATVLTAFMSGLALGSYIAGRVMERPFNPIRVYGLLEGGIGLYCLLIPKLLQVMVPLYQLIYNELTTSFFLFSLIRFFFCSLILLIPTAMMGATLPVLSKYFVDRYQRLGWTIGKIYSLNTFGAALGSLVSGFVLLPYLGTSLTIYLAAFINLAIAFVVILLSWGTPPGLPALPGISKPLSKPKEVGTRAKGKSILKPHPHMPLSPILLELSVWSLAASGFASMTYELAWTRVLSLAIGSSHYAFSLILTTFILGLALGSLLLSRYLDNCKDLLGIFGQLQLSIGLIALILIPLLPQLPIIMVRVLQNYGQRFYLLQGIEFGLIFLLLLIPTLLIGITFPLISKVYTKGVEKVSSSVGRVYAINTVGSILGSFVSGFILIPYLGLQKTIVAAALMNILPGLLIIFLNPGFSIPNKLLKLSIGLFLTLIILYFTPSWNRYVLNSGAYIYYSIYQPISGGDSFSIKEAMESQGKILYYKEGVTATVSVYERAIDRALTLQINGKVDASTRHRDMPTQILTAHLPLLLHPAPEQVLLIGLGSGLTLGSIEQYPVKEIDTVEISPEVVEAAALFQKFTHNALADSRLNLIIGDGRNHLLLRKKRYDVIISEPSNLWIAGMGNLFSADYYRLVKQRLKENGIICQWVQAYNLSDTNFRSLLKTFTQAFPASSLWEISTGGDYLLLGGMREFKIDLPRLEHRLAQPEIKADLARIGRDNIYSILGIFVMDGAEASLYAKDAAVHTDDNNLIEFRASQDLYLPVRTDKLLEGLAPHRKPIIPLVSNWGRDREEYENTLQRVYQARLHITRGILSMLAGRGKRALKELKKGVDLNPADAEAGYALTDLALSWGEEQLANGLPDQAIALYQSILDIRPDLAEVYYLLAGAFSAKGWVQEAAQAYQKAINLNPNLAPER